MALYSVLTWDVTIWRICIIASLTAFVNDAMNASVKRALLIHGFSFSKSPCGYKNQGKRLLPEAPKCSDHSFSLVFLLSPS